MYRFAPLFVIIAAALWGIDGILLRPELFNLPVPLVVFTESSIVALLLSPILFKYKSEFKLLAAKDWLAFLGVALFGGAIGTMAITKALFYVNYVNLSIVILIQKLQPIFALILASFLLKEKLTKSFFVWSGVAISGTYLMTFGFHLPEINPNDSTVLAAVFSVIAAFSFGSSTVLSKRALRNISFEFGTYLRFLLSAGILLIIVLLTREYSGFTNISQTQILIFLLIAFSTGGPAIFLYYYGLKKITASVAAICELAFPLTAIVLEYILRHNILGPVQWFGVIILMFSIYKVTKLHSY